MSNNLGFQIPTSEMVEKPIREENYELNDKKRRLLTELAAIETGFSLFEFMNPARDLLQSSASDMACSVELLSNPKTNFAEINHIAASQQLANIIMEIAENPSSESYTPPSRTPKCVDIVRHSKSFFAQLKSTREARTSFLSSFCMIPQRSKLDKSRPQPIPEKINEDDLGNSKRVHPFFPDIKGVQPFLGAMKKQLGEFPNFIKNPPSDDECDESSWLMKDDSLHNHLLEICGSSSDDDFDPDANFVPNRTNISHSRGH